MTGILKLFFLDCSSLSLPVSSEEQGECVLLVVDDYMLHNNEGAGTLVIHVQQDPRAGGTRLSNQLLFFFFQF